MTQNNKLEYTLMNMFYHVFHHIQISNLEEELDKNADIDGVNEEGDKVEPVDDT